MCGTLTTRIILFCVICGCAAINNKPRPFEFHVTNDLKANDLTKAVKSLMNRQIQTYFSAAKPERFYTCAQRMAIVRCIKIYFFQRLDSNREFSHTENLANDLISQFLLNNKTYPSLTDKIYSTMSDSELTNKLKDSLAKFFKARVIKFQYSDVLIKFIPSKVDKIKLLFKKGKRVKKSHKTYKKIVEVAVPVMLMPAILLGTFLPFIIPTLKAAAIVSTLINNGALLAALLYAAKNAAPNNDEAVHYSFPGYH